MPNLHSSGHSLSAICKLVLIILLGLLAQSSFGGAAGFVRSFEYVFKAGDYARVARLANLTSKDLRFASKVDNVNGLLELAEQERRIDPIQMMRLSRAYSSSIDGDGLLLICLRVSACQPETFLQVVNTSKLHGEVAIRNPGLGLVQAHHLVGALTENLMVRYFRYSGWTRVEGQVGRTGFDGLFVKYEGDVIKDVLIVESKYNTSLLQTTNHGVQMSEKWVLRKMVELKERFPDESVYRKIEPFIEAGAYRSVLWNLKVEDDALKIGLSKVKSKGGTVDVGVALGTDIETFSAPFTNSIQLHAPRDKFEEMVLGWYNGELGAIGTLSTK